MRSLDTNVLARLFVALSERAFVSVTVLMEFEWVMRA